MELVSDIIRLRKSKDNIDNIHEKLKDLNITSIASQYHNHIDFLKNIDRDKISSILTPVFEQDLTNTVIMAYYFVHYKDSVFDSFKTRSEVKLIKCAYTLVNHIDSLNKHDFINKLDRFNSLYFLWSNKQNIADMDIIYQNITESINMYNYSKKYNITRKIVCKNIKKSIDDLFRINSNIAVKILISDYYNLSSISSVTKKIWKKIKYNYNTNIFLILVSELKNYVIHKLEDISSIKKIYYDLDIEEVVKNLYTNDLNLDQVNNILSILSKSINIEYRFCYTDRSIIKSLRKIFDSIYHHYQEQENVNIQVTKIIITSSNTNLIYAI